MAAVLAMLALAAGGGAAAAPAQPWEPPAGARWQYQLESSDKSLKSTGGIDVNICQPPAGGGSPAFARRSSTSTCTRTGRSRATTTP